MSTASVTYGERHGRTMVHISGQLDLEGVNAVRERLQHFVTTGCLDLVVDLQALEFCDSSGFGVLVAVRRQLAAAGGRLRLVLPTEGTPVRDTLTVFGISRLFDTYDTPAEAVAPASGTTVPSPAARRQAPLAATPASGSQRP